MGWSIGTNCQDRDVGYGVPAICDYPGCNNEINRGLSYVCGDMHDGGDYGCGLYFCENHLTISDKWGVSICDRCENNELPYEPKKDSLEWIQWKLIDDSWYEWRKQNPNQTKRLYERCLLDISQKLKTQDNRCTRDPIFQVRGIKRLYGMDPNFSDNLVWIDTEIESAHCEVENPSKPNENIIKTGYIEVEEVLMSSFSEEGCKEHLELNRHNYSKYREVYIYVDTLRRCPEMILIRNYLLNLIENGEEQ